MTQILSILILIVLIAEILSFTTVKDLTTKSMTLVHNVTLVGLTDKSPQFTTVKKTSTDKLTANKLPIYTTVKNLITTLKNNVTLAETTNKSTTKTTTTKKTTNKVTTKKSTKKTTTKKGGIKTTSKSLTTSTTSPPLSQCYLSYDGLLGSVYYSFSNQTSCNTSCSFSRKVIGTQLIEERNCNIDNYDSAFFLVSLNKTYRHDCCSTNNCNTLEKFDTLDYKCESNIIIEPDQELIFPVEAPNKFNATKCYACDSCLNPEEEAQVQICSPKSPGDLFACQHLYEYNHGRKLWTGYCSNVRQVSHLSFKDFNIKAAFCYSDLCNSVGNMENLENMILCEDGFYE